MTFAERHNIISTIFNKIDLAFVNTLLANTSETWNFLQEPITNSGGAVHQMASVCILVNDVTPTSPGSL